LNDVNARYLEIACLGLVMLAVLVGGQTWMLNVAHSPFHGIAIAILGTIAVILLYAFRRSFLAGGPLARVHATRDAAFLAAIGAAMAYVAAPAHWSLGAAIVAVEFGLIVELMSRFSPAPPS
jgi:hypothetical protein